MTGNRLIELLFSLTPWELNHFHDFLHSPYHNKNQRVQQLFGHLRACWPDMEAADLEPEACFGAIYPDAPFQKQKLYNIYSLLFRNLEEFLILEQRKEEQRKPEPALLQAYLNRGWGPAFDKAYRSFSRRLPEQSGPDIFVQHLNAFQVETLRINRLLQQGRAEDRAIYLANSELDQFYFGSKLKMVCEFLNRGNVIRQEADDLAGLEILVRQLPGIREQFPEKPHLRMYLLICEMLLSPEENAIFFSCLDFIRTEKGIERQERRAGLSYLINFCIRRINLGQETFQETLFDLYQWAIDREILLEEGKIGEWHYKNIVTIGIRERAYEWVGEFIRSHKEKLPLEVRENAFVYNLASLSFAQGKLSRARKLLLQVRFNDVFYNLDSKVLLAKIYFEEEEWEALANLLGTFSVFLSRNKVISAYQLKLYRNFVSFLRKLSRFAEKRAILSPQKTSETRLSLLDQLENNKAVAQLAWLQEKLRA